MQMAYDYRVEGFDDRRKLERYLNQMGQQGYHVVGLIPLTEQATWTGNGSRTTEILAVIERTITGTGAAQGQPTS